MNDRKPIIAPSILSADMGELKKDITGITQAGADWIHIDVMDGNFVPPITFGDNVVKVAKAATKLFLDVHLMVLHPETHFESFKEAGADRIIVHQECCKDLPQTLTAISELKMQNGVAINPATPVATVLDVIEIADLVLVMTVNPGWGGQKFMPSCLTKIEELANHISKRKAKTTIEVDGGINEMTVKQCWDAGATVFVAGSYVFGSSDRGFAISKLRDACA